MKKPDRRWAIVVVWMVFLVVNWPAIAFLFQRWMSSPELNHGLAVPFITAFLIYRSRHHRPAQAGKPWLGIIPLSVGLVLLVLAVWADIKLLYGVSLPISITGLCWIFYGGGWVRARLFPLTFLFMAVPWPDFLIDKLSVPMQHSSAAISGWVLGLFLPIQREGVHLWTPRFDAEIAVACSGIRSLMAITTVAALLAACTPVKPGWKWLLFASSIPITYIANVIRIVLIFIIGHFINSKLALTLFHDNAGILLLVLSGVTLSALRQHMTSRFAVEQADVADRHSLTPHITSWRRIAMVTICLIFAMWAITAADATRGSIPTRTIRTLDVPYSIEGWTVTDETDLPDDALKLLTPDAVVNRTYRNEPGDYINVLVVYGHLKNSFHSPSFCLPGDGWNIQKEFQLQVKGDRSSIPFRVMLMEMNNSRILVVYSYIQPDGACVGLVQHNLKLAAMRFRHQVTTGASLRLVVSVKSDEDSAVDTVLPLCKSLASIVQNQLNSDVPAKIK
ncbi:MAG: exosortase C-terminal domain/associated protein EpsI [Armatimonadota bacterium]